MKEVCQSIDSLEIDEMSNFTLARGDHRQIQTSLKQLKLYKEELEDQERETRNQEMEEKERLLEAMSKFKVLEHSSNSLGNCHELVKVTHPRPKTSTKINIRHSHHTKVQNDNIKPGSATSFLIRLEDTDSVPGYSVSECCDECSSSTNKDNMINEDHDPAADSMTLNCQAFAEKEAKAEWTTAMKKQPNWLQEMKDDLKKKEQTCQDVNIDSKASPTPRSSRGVKGVAMSKLSLKPKATKP